MNDVYQTANHFSFTNNFYPLTWNLEPGTLNLELITNIS